MLYARHTLLIARPMLIRLAWYLFSNFNTKLIGMEYVLLQDLFQELAFWLQCKGYARRLV